MSPGLVVRPEALEEIADAAAWYDGRASGLSADFLRALDATLAAVSRNPRQYPVIRSDLRRALLRKFPYSVIFTATDRGDRRGGICALAPGSTTLVQARLISRVCRGRVRMRELDMEKPGLEAVAQGKQDVKEFLDGAREGVEGEGGTGAR